MFHSSQVFWMLFRDMKKFTGSMLLVKYLTVVN